MLFLRFEGDYDTINLRSVGNKEVFKRVGTLIIEAKHMTEPLLKCLDKIECERKYLIGVHVDLEKYKVLARNFEDYLAKFPSPEILKELIPDCLYTAGREMQHINEVLRVPCERKHFVWLFSRRDSQYYGLLFDKPIVELDEVTRELHYECFRPDIFRGMVNFLLRKCVNLRELSLKAGEMYLSFIHPTDDLQGVEALKLERIKFAFPRADKGGIPFLANIIKKSGETLRHLDLAFEYQGYPKDLGTLLSAI